MNKSTLKKVFRYVGRYWFFLICSILCAAVTVTLTLYIPILTGDAIDCILEPGKVDFDAITGILKKMVLAIAFLSIALRC